MDMREIQQPRFHSSYQTKSELLSTTATTRGWYCIWLGTLIGAARLLETETLLLPG